MTTFRIVTAVTAGTLTLGMLAGCSDILPRQQRLDFSRTEEVKITNITLEPGAGDVTVTTAAVSNVRINRVVRYRGDQPGDTYRIEGTELLVDTDCGRNCGVSYEILAPEGVSVSGESGSGDIDLSKVAAVDVKVGSGDITVAGATGAVRTQTGSGDISLTEVSTTSTARTGSGSISGYGLAGTVEATAGSGDISLAFGAAGSVRAEASSGSIDVTVLAGPYRVRSHTGSGSAEVNVADDPAATNSIDVTAGSGDILIAAR
jgi:hypothetical protein